MKTKFEFTSARLSIELQVRYTQKNPIETFTIEACLDKLGKYKIWSSFEKKRNWKNVLAFYQIPGHFGLALFT